MVNDDAIIANTADAERIGLACEALVRVLLGSDRRVQLAYQQFLVTRHRTHDVVDYLVHHDLKLDYAWLPTLLVMSFAAKALGELSGIRAGLG